MAFVCDCSVGRVLGDACHVMTYTRTSGIKRIDSLERDVRELIFWRSGLSLLNSEATICNHNEYVLVKRFPMSYKKCSDPFKKHKKYVKGM